ncbi:hypothetical protein [Kineococcus aurantiacus]|uniref:Uncharacterized protein n=1 Tax=Kineococcus aurantiacus TaxID=37633 RepID=A0A7Y9DM51_9ACTN|nr:hypothetical protein [Kineococcus aurantiacus]NYD23098.1 hypothetical protein [Kineococcus aurantiacus]
MSVEGEQRARGRRWAVPSLVLGIVLVVAGVAFHGVAAAHRPSGPGGSDTWETVLDHAALGWAAYGAVAAGVFLTVRGWNSRGGR